MPRERECVLPEGLRGFMKRKESCAYRRGRKELAGGKLASAGEEETVILEGEGTES